MQKLKFRAWDIVYENYYEVTAIDFQSNQLKVKNDAGEYRCVEFNDVILEQYTGLRDKNGKEICVGDIVKMTFLNEYINISTVEGVFSFAQWKWENLSTIEIIGNINENEGMLT